ncbi:hypothetical protein JR316_0011363 [Psilocybe cubensis]|uniref:Uncharacterized protein n=1 Tax=Psilocybe cubensis TaxID=181762 RepID=A0ACB8GJD2_PSICU|nr:hypothetical protein JR316_0011363 [Psilocybe cubensis]KAH9475803.1 hypothetical protein JR316_0011363 [Psilocybe cubensis]
MSSFLSFLNQKLAGDKASQGRTTVGDNGLVAQQRKEFLQMYQAYEKVFKSAATVDVAWAFKTDRAGELEAAIESFPRTSSIVMEGLLRLANLLPSFGVVVNSWYSIFQLNFARAKEHKKVLFVLLQIQATLCTLFQLKQVNSVSVRSEADRLSLQRLLISLAQIITECGSDLNYYLSTNTPVRLFYVNFFEKQWLIHVNKLIKRREELQKFVDSILSLHGVRTTSIKDLGEKVMNLNVSETPEETNKRFHIFKARFLARLRTKDELDVISTINERIGNLAQENPLEGQVRLREIFLDLFCKEDLVELVGYVGNCVSKVMDREGPKRMGNDSSSHSHRFNKLLEMVNRILERRIARVQRQIKEMQQSGIKVESPFVISVSKMNGGKRYILVKAPTTLEDPNFESSVEIRIFILKLREYIGGQEGSNDHWVLDYVDLAHIQPIAEALGSPASGSVNVRNVHQFALSRPDGLRLCTVAEEHTHETPASVDPRLVELACHVAQMQEEVISANLKDASFNLMCPNDAKLVGGPERVETWILPLLHLLLQRHLEIIQIAQNIVLDELEMIAHNQSLVSTFRTFEGRIKELDEMFKLDEKYDLERQLKSFAYGMFSTYMDKKAAASSEQNKLNTFKNANGHPNHNFSNWKRIAIDTSILVYGPGKPFEFTECDHTLPPPDSRTHPLQDAWHGSTLQIYIKSFNADMTFTGTGEAINFTADIVGKVVPISQENPKGCLMVYFRGRLPDELDLVDILFKGMYDPDRDIIEGETASYDGYDVDSIASLTFDTSVSQPVTFGRARPYATRFRWLLNESSDNSSNIARRRWKFATQATLLKVQADMNSVKIVQRGLQDHRNWHRKLKNAGLDDPELDFLKTEMMNYPPENVRLYASLYTYLYARRSHAL